MKGLKLIWNIFTVVVVAAVVAFTALLLVPKLFGVSNFVVTSGSMEPSIHVGSMIYVTPLDSPEDYSVGDVITFRMAGAPDVVATHRIISIEETDNTDSGICFETKGDNNDVPDDARVDPSLVIGKCVFHVPCMGYILNYAQTPPGCYVIGGAGVLLVLLLVLPGILQEDLSDKGKKDPDPTPDTDGDGDDL